VLSKDAEPRSIGHARPSDPGSVTAFVAPQSSGEAKVAGAPGDGCSTFGLSAPTPWCVVRFFVQFQLPFAVANCFGPSTLRALVRILLISAR
jgi:hypothetical protein